MINYLSAKIARNGIITFMREMESRKDIEYEIKRVEELTKDVYGEICLQEARLLYYLAKEGPGEGVIVEIGSLCGYSTIWLACGSKWAKREKVYAIDPQDTPEDGNNEIIFKENIKKAGVDDWVIPLIMTSEEAAKNWGGDPIRLLFIDGNHEYEYVRKDFVLWEPKLIDGGVIVFHDCFYVRSPDVLKCVKENIFDSDKFGELGTIDTILYAFKRNELTPFERMKKENFIKLLTPHQKIIQSVEDIQISLQEGKFDKAEERLKEMEGMIYTLDNEFPDLWKVTFYSLAGDFLLGQCRLNEAESKYNKALSIDVLDLQKSPAILGLAGLYTQQGKHKEAESKYKEALSLEVPDSQRFHAILGLAGLYTQQGKHKEAESKYKEALSLEVPDSQRFHAILGLADLYTQQGKYNEAESRYNEALSMESLLTQRQRLNIFWVLGSLYVQQQRYKEAEERLDQALSLADSIGLVLEAANIHYNKGSMYEKMELSEEAKREFKATLTLLKDATSLKERELKGGAYFHLGCIYKRENDKRAESFFKECLIYIPNHKKAKEELLSCIISLTE
jgi:tetratricopeptide (TPR) repeat protein/predicted O-methyltransferase YrrM